MKNWNPEQWVRILLAFAVTYFICTYITGMFVLNPPTTDSNRDLRMAVVILITTIVNNLFNNKRNDKL